MKQVNFRIEPVISNKGTCYILSIEKVYVDCNDEILIFGNRFNTEEEVEKFKKTNFLKVS
jgi:hypothetical protein